MCEDRDPHMQGPKLCPEAQNLLISMIIGGHQNNAIRQRLVDDGHYGQLSDQTFSEYRKRPEVKEAKAAALEEAKQLGMVSLEGRIITLHDLLQDAVSRLKGRAKDAFGDVSNPPPFHAYMYGLGPVVNLAKEISRLVDTIDPKGESGIPDGGTSHEKAVISTGQVLDALERLVEETEAAREAGEEPAGREGTN